MLARVANDGFLGPTSVEGRSPLQAARQSFWARLLVEEAHVPCSHVVTVVVSVVVVSLKVIFTLVLASTALLRHRERWWTASSHESLRRGVFFVEVADHAKLRRSRMAEA